FQSTSASISCSTPCDLRASTQPRRSPNAVGLRSTDIWPPRACNILGALPGPAIPLLRASSVVKTWMPGTSPGRTSEGAELLQEAFRRRRNLSDEIAHAPLVQERVKFHLARFETRGAGINGLAVELDHAFLARIGIDAGKADGERRIAIGADPAQSVEHGLTGLEGNFIPLPSSAACAFTAP